MPRAHSHWHTLLTIFPLWDSHQSYFKDPKQKHIFSLYAKFLITAIFQDFYQDKKLVKERGKSSVSFE